MEMGTPPKISFTQGRGLSPEFPVSRMGHTGVSSANSVQADFFNYPL